MNRTLFGALVLLCVVGTSAWGQEIAPKPDQAATNLVWLSLLVPMFGFVMLVLLIIRRRGNVSRSMQLVEELVQASKQQVALQAETNRLLQQLLDAQGQGDQP